MTTEATIATAPSGLCGLEGAGVGDAGGASGTSDPHVANMSSSEWGPPTGIDGSIDPRRHAHERSGRTASPAADPPGTALYASVANVHDARAERPRLDQL